MQTFLGMDFGGTKLLIGEVSRTGEVLASRRYATGCSDEKQAEDMIRASLSDYLAQEGIHGQLKAAGVGIVGVSDHRKGLWISMTHEVRGEPVPLAGMVGAMLGVPAALDNDVRSSTTAEMILGYGRRYRDFIYVNVGTGLAAGFVSDGRIIRGAGNNSGEVGHMSCDLNDDTPCVCGRRGCAENAVSGTGFTAQYLRLRSQYPDSALSPGKDGKIRAEDLFRLSDSGDLLARRIADYGVRTLASLIMNLVRVTDPELVILGGGVMRDGWMLDKIRPLLNPATMRGVHGGVVLSSLEPETAGLIGAASLGMQLTETP